jgi:hypothetical protein
VSDNEIFSFRRHIHLCPLKNYMPQELSFRQFLFNRWYDRQTSNFLKILLPPTKMRYDGPNIDRSLLPLSIWVQSRWQTTSVILRKMYQVESIQCVIQSCTYRYFNHELLASCRTRKKYLKNSMLKNKMTFIF